MKRTLAGALVGVILGVGAASLAPRADGQQTPALIRGGGSAGVEKEPTFRFGTQSGQVSTVDFDRNVLKVPSYYGEPIAVTMGRRPVVWYRAADGALRNVILPDEASLVRVSTETPR